MNIHPRMHLHVGGVATVREVVARLRWAQPSLVLVFCEPYPHSEVEVDDLMPDSQTTKDHHGDGKMVCVAPGSSTAEDQCRSMPSLFASPTLRP